MQLNVTQTITSTENNYKANVNFTGGTYSFCKFGLEPKISNTEKKELIQYECQFIDTKENRQTHTVI